MKNGGLLVCLGVALMALAGCQSGVTASRSARAAGDAIIVAGQRFSTGTRVVTWLEPDGYNAYQPGPAPAPRGGVKQPAPVLNHTPRTLAGKALTARSPLARLQATVDQVVLHYDVCGLSKICFNVLQQRGLSTHFLLDLDGTIYQTLDLQERALHATVANNRSIGIEIAHIGAYPPGDTTAMNDWYRRDAAGRPFIQVPARIADPRLLTPGYVGRPARAQLIRGQIQDKPLQQYDFTPEQYAALSKLLATLCRVLPQVRCDYPRDTLGRLIPRKLPDATLEKYRGILGHFHIQENKFDPGPALQWEKLIQETRSRLR